MQNIRFRTKIRILVYALLAAAVAVGVVGFGRLNDADTDVLYAQSHWLPSVVVLAKVRGQIQIVRHALTRHILASNAAEMDRWEQVVRSAQEDIRTTTSSSPRGRMSGSRRRSPTPCPSSSRR